MHIDRAHALAAFHDYLASYDTADPKIALKAEHSLRVAELCERIAASLPLPEADVDLAWLCGLLHDIGRFEQIRRWNTFSDAKSTSHAALSARILFEPEGRKAAASARPADRPAGADVPILMRSFAADASQDALIRTAIELHSDFRLPAGLDDRTRTFCDIVRDADKVDIVHTTSTSTPFDLFGASDDEFRESPVSPEALAGFFSHRCLLRSERVFPADYVVGFACFAFELVHPASSLAMQDQGFLFKLLEQPFGFSFSRNDTAEIFSDMLAHMRSWLSNRIDATQGEDVGEGSDPKPTSTDEPSGPIAAVDAHDPVFGQEQSNLAETYAKLQQIGRALVRKMERAQREAAADKKAMAEELAPNFATYADAMETYADFAAMNRVIDGYNLAQDADAAELAKVELLLKQPYFAKVALQFKPGQEPKELYIGTAGISDENYRRLVVDWRSPVAETYYNQDNGRTSYVADGRTITADLKLRRQFDIEEDRLNAYFNTTVAIQDSLLLASLSKQRTAQMKAITATIQKEQNTVVRHEDVPVLLVSGIAGSGKTSVLLQRIAYLFYQQRGSLDASEVFLVSPNPVFSHYIASVLPDLGEHNPESLTWNEFARRLLPPNRGSGDVDVSLAALARIDRAVESFEFDANDFKDVRVGEKRLIAADQIRKLAEKLGRIPAGPHRITLMREELYARLESRLKQMAGTDEALDELEALEADEQLRIFGELIAPTDEQEERALALRYLTDRYADAFAAVENDAWLRIDRIGMRLLETDGLAPLEWLYLKMALTGLGNPDAKYVMVDEVQDYTAAQLAVLARYFRRAHFLLLGDPNQAIVPDTATFDEVREVFQAARGAVEECRLMTSYRSTPEITALFASLLPPEEQLQVSSIQRADEPPTVRAFGDDAYADALHAAGAGARAAEGLAAVIVPWKHEAKRLQQLLGDDAPPLLDERGELPDSGIVLITLQLAKGLEFDHVIVPDASPRVFPADDDLARRRLYTTLSRATRGIAVLARGALTPLLEGAAS